MSAILVAAGAFAAANVASVVLLWKRRDRPARLVATAVAGITALAWAFIALGSAGDTQRIFESAMIAVALAAPSLATLVLVSLGRWPWKGLALAVAAIAIPVLVSGLLYFTPGIYGEERLAILIPALLALQIVTVLAVAVRVFIPAPAMPVVATATPPAP